MEKIDLMWHGLNSANNHLTFKEEMTGLLCDLFTTKEMIASGKAWNKFLEIIRFLCQD